MNDQIKEIENVLSLVEPADTLDWAEGFTLTTEQAEAIQDPKFGYPNLVIESHVIAIVGEPGSGKTTILQYVAGMMAEQGYSVYYVNADTSGGDAKPMVLDAKEHGYKMLLPDLAGRSMAEIIEHLIVIRDGENDYTGTIFIFDTLKKMVDVISKSKAKELYKLFRALSAKGMTIVLLAHTNKYKDADGNPVYEGTADLRSDIDELIYLIPEKRPDGSMIVSTKPDKVRGAFQPISFEITPEREVIELDDYRDTSTAVHLQIQREQDGPVIDAICEAIRDGKLKQTEITEHTKSCGIGWRTTVAVLKRYRIGNPDGHEGLWSREKGFQHNQWTHSLADNPLPHAEW